MINSVHLNAIQNTEGPLAHHNCSINMQQQIPILTRDQKSYESQNFKAVSVGEVEMT